VKQAEEASFVDLIACERDCRSCSYAAALDCDGNCGVCPHNSYCPCVNPVVARSKSALRLIELRPILLQDLRVQVPKNLVDAARVRDLVERIRSTSGRL
jgi:hypothetical protein